MHMKVSINLIKPNPFRDFDLDPIGQSQVAKLAQSHAQIGQFGAIPARPHPTEAGFYEQASGHHNVEAMRLRGDREVNLEVRERSDSEMAQLLALENLTQRTNNAGAMADAVAARARLVAMDVLLHNSVEQNKRGDAQTRQRLLSDGPGAPAIYAGLNGFSSADKANALADGAAEIIGRRDVEASVAALKATGVMARIMAEVYAEAEAIWAAQDAAEAEAHRLAEEQAEAERQKLEAEAQRQRDEAEKLEAAKRTKEADDLRAKAAATATKVETERKTATATTKAKTEVKEQKTEKRMADKKVVEAQVKVDPKLRHPLRLDLRGPKAGASLPRRCSGTQWFAVHCQGAAVRTGASDQGPH